MVRKIIRWAGMLVILALIGGGVYLYDRFFKGIWPAVSRPPADITELIPPAELNVPPPPIGATIPPPLPLPLPPGSNTTNLPLKLPPGFSISIFAKGLDGARDMALDGEGNLWVSRTKHGVITKLVVESGVVKSQSDAYRQLNKPHGLAFDLQNLRTLYFAEADKISRVTTGTRVKPENVAELPSGGNHNYYSLRFGPDDRLYVSMGSTCNVCIEKDERRAKIYSLKRDGSDFKEFARGLRNAPFMAFNPVDGKMWATEMGRDFLGDDLPPDEINIIESGKNYGWPNCYGKNIHDTDFDKNTYIRNPCMEPFETPSFIDIPAHSAPLGLAFVSQSVPRQKSTGREWPEEYDNDLIVSYHGSWNRTTPTGYKVVRMKIDSNGNYQGTEDLITGWLRPDGALGRPVGILIQPGGTMYISDDGAGVIYRVTYGH